MREPSPHSVAERRRLLVAQASAALRGHVVTLWRLQDGGPAVAEVVSRPDAPQDALNFDLTGLLKRWGRATHPGSLWVGCRVDVDRWHVALVRSDPPRPPPNGIERRRPEQLIVELAGLSLGALERLWTEPPSDQATVYLCTALELIEICLLRVHSTPGLSPSARARLLADLAGVSGHIDNALVA